VDDRELVDSQVVDVENRRQLHAPVDRLERSVAVKQVDSQTEIMRIEELVRTAKELVAVGPRRALERGRRRGNLPFFQDHEAGGRKIKKGVLADDRIVGFEDILVEWIPPASLDVRVVIDQRVSLVVAIP